MPGRHVTVGIALVLVLSACGGAAPVPVPPAPSQGGPPWLELASEHFTVWTDDTAAHGRALIRTMEHLRQVIYGVSFFHPTTSTKCFVIALRNVEEVHAYVPEQFIAYAFSPRNVLMQPVIVLPLDHLEDDPRIVTHELTHAISYAALPDQPHWFAEGLATYFETIRVHDDAGYVDVGVPLDFRVRELRDYKARSIASVFACNQPACMDDHYYATVWALFTFLMNHHPEQLMRYMLALAAGGSTDWNSSAPELPPTALDHELAQWLAHGKVLVKQYRLELKDSPVEERPLGDADAYAARGLLRYLQAWQAPLPAEIAQAIAADPVDVIARMIQANHDRAITLELAQQIETAHPADWRAWWLVAHATPSGPHTLEARHRMCELIATTPVMAPRGVCP